MLENSEVETRYQALVSKFRAREYRITPQRLAILRLLAESTDHPSAGRIYQELYDRFPTMSLATVYKTLAVLKEMGEVLELSLGEGENRYDGHNAVPHPHLICTRCGKILDSDVVLDQDVIATAAKASGFKILSHRLDLYGVCPECQRAESVE